MQTAPKIPIVYDWIEKSDVINTDSIVDVVDWCAKFSGNHRLPKDVGLALERAVIGTYQIGYLFDYVKMKDIDNFTKKLYIEEGIASVLIHIIASYQMTGRDLIKTINKNTSSDTNFMWSKFIKKIHYKSINMSNESALQNNIFLNISEHCFKYQRWILYYHMGRTKRWDEKLLNSSILDLLINCLRLGELYECDVGRGFALAMSKIQDGEIKRH